jgi:hypothetical protein
VLAVVVETEDLLKTVVASAVAGVGITATFSIMIFGLTRFADLRRDERPLLATAAGALAVVALLATAGGIALGIIAMTSKS